jgi:hypothetical protein
MFRELSERMAVAVPTLGHGAQFCAPILTVCDPHRAPNTRIAGGSFSAALTCFGQSQHRFGALG